MKRIKKSSIKEKDSIKFLKYFYISISLIFFITDIFFKYFSNVKKTINPGTFFGLFQNIKSVNLFFIVFNLTLLFLFFLLFFCFKVFTHKYLFFPLFFGGLSNIMDRILVGGVIDYIKIIPIFGIFNLSDILILLFIISGIYLEFLKNS